MKKDKFELRIEDHKKNVADYTKTCNKLSIIRLLAMVLGIYFTYDGLKKGFNSLNLFLMFSFYAVFVVLIIYHKKFKDKLNFSKEIIKINQKYLDRINGDWVSFEDVGEEFIDHSHKYSRDLDIVGQKSIFQLINITNTFNGRKRLGKDLLNGEYSLEEITLRQEAIKELHEKLDLCEEMEYITGKHKKKLNSPEKLVNYAEDSDVLIKSKGLKGFIYTLPLITFPLILVISSFNISKFRILVPLIIILQILIWAMGFLKLNNILGDIGNFKYNLDTYVHILKLIEGEEFSSEKLKVIKVKLFKEENSSMIAIKELGKISEKVNLRYNGFLYMLLNIFLLWDYQCVFSLEAWRRKYGNKIRESLELIGEIESLMSLSVLTHINEEVSYPKIEHGKVPKVESRQLGHPLINSKDRVANDLVMNNNIFIITGSNMSGKTTFLRTIGINLVLAYSGAPVCAKEMSCSILDIFTSMRITDDLNNGISTFYAELMRIKEIIKESKENKSMIFLIDEIFRGTNSLDRILGAKTVLGNLNSEGIIGAITTHDLELCELEKYSRIVNYHFSEHYKDDKIYFDYKLKNGKSTTTNAKFLMKIVGIDVL
ncbi:MutS family DNA mismatch repair protein [Hathewaya massiliensis]|uniref:MutS family DNA mismatch repair protein n=1 Tax=Hathewaya massiliensis TaxID=1964382 RepID=UPI0011570857|nr:MutS family DNA mismatch repair protein [Hathewaya massiliensis]